MAGQTQKKENVEFNDDEIDQIMDELDKLQEEMDQNAESVSNAASSSEKKEEPQLSVVPDPKSKKEEPAVDELDAEISAEMASDSDESILDEFRGSSDDASMEETVGDLEADTASDTLIDPVESKEEPSTSSSSAKRTNLDFEEPKPPHQRNSPAPRQSSRSQIASNADGSLKLSLTGQMQLQIAYEQNGSEITINFENDCLHVQLTDGTEFKIPLKK